MCFFSNNCVTFFLTFFSPIGYGPQFQVVHVASNTQAASGMYLYEICFFVKIQINNILLNILGNTGFYLQYDQIPCGQQLNKNED